ncbi:transposase [Pseudomonas sp. RIT-PI-S]|uniref:REP-associated tyrosine transposase n=1 Tax=Pseudomonas sp. RIT-PI-S TaxID=3035295 RepID=UPI0021D878B5|nr:transposase [Pseudomonas sp. RIT-PI-S]
MWIYQSKRLRTGRRSEVGRAYVITTATNERQPLLANWATGRLVVRELCHEHAAGHARSIAWVVMPDHLHWLFELGEGDLSAVVRRVKARSAQAVNQQLGRTGALWQKGFHDRAIRREEDLRSVARYIIMNPVRAGLVPSVGLYPLWDAMWL